MLLMDKPQFVYFVTFASDLSNEFPCKIGYTRNLKTRFSGLQNSHSEPLRALLVLVTPDCKRLETIIHQELLSKNIRGEIFKLTISEILEASRKYTALDDTFIYSGTIELAGESVKIPFLEVFGENSEAKTDESKEKGGFECRKTFDNQNRKVPCDKTITCNECQKCFGNIGKYNMHKRNGKCHKEEESLEEEGNIKPSTNTSRESIKKLLKRIKILACDKCSRKFKTKQALKRHTDRKIPCDRKLQCEKCGKTFQTQRDLDRHIEDRKTPCEPIVGGEAPTVSIGENKCIFCGRDFTTPKRLENHIQKCRIANNKKVFAAGSLQPGLEVLLDTVKRQQEQIDKLTKVLENMGAPTQINNTVNNTFNIQLVMNFYEDPDYKHLRLQDLKELTKLLNDEMHKIIPAITEKVHGDRQATKNHNICLPSLEKDSVLIVDGHSGKKEWKEITLREAFQVLLKRGVDLMYKADDDLTTKGLPALTDEEGEKFEMLINKQRSNSVYDEDIEEIKPILYRMKVLVNK